MKLILNLSGLDLTNYNKEQQQVFDELYSNNDIFTSNSGIMHNEVEWNCGTRQNYFVRVPAMFAKYDFEQK